MFIGHKIFSIPKKVFNLSQRAFLRCENYIPTETKEEIGRKVISISEKVVSKTSSFFSSLKQKVFLKRANPISEKLIEESFEKTVTIPLGNEISKPDLSQIPISEFFKHKFQTDFLPKINENLNLLN